MLSGANLSSKRRNSNSHIIGPCLLNSFYVCYLPIILGILSESSRFERCTKERD